MNILDLQTTESLKIGDTKISANDLSEQYLDRSVSYTLNKNTYPELYEIYKKSTGDKFIDKTAFSNISNNSFTDFIETNNKYLFLNSPATLEFKILDKDMNNLLRVSSGIMPDLSPKYITGDNQNIIINSVNISNARFYYSNNFDIENNIIGTIKTKTINSTTDTARITNVVFLNDYFIITISYSSNRFIFFKIYKDNINYLENISGIFNNDRMLSFVIFDNYTINSNNNLGLTLTSTSNFIFLENEEIYFYLESTKKVYKFNQNNYFNIEIYDELLTTDSNDLVSLCYYKNSFIMTFNKVVTANPNVIFIINDNGVKIKHDSTINTNINTGTSLLLYVDFINKKIITKNDTGNILYFDSFLMNNKTESVFNVALNSSNFNAINRNFAPYGTNFKIFFNKNPIFMTLSGNIILENLTNQYDTFKVKFIQGSFSDFYTIPAIVSGNLFDKYWTKKG